MNHNKNNSDLVKVIIKDQSLTADVLEILRKGKTERPYTGQYDKFYERGSYLCKGCGEALFRAHSKFDSSCGWPSFDQSLSQAVTEQMDKDGIRTEIICSQCQGHLGHVFDGEQFTAKNKRYCVNSRCLDFIQDTEVLHTQEAIIAGGCFWGVEHLFEKLPGVLGTEVGYIGGEKLNPYYAEVCTSTSGYFEAVRVLYSPSQINYESILKYFFEIHNPSQADGQGPDLGNQYRSAIFYYNDDQALIAKKLIQELQQNIPISTQLFPMKTFWPAEPMHQRYYFKTQSQPYCHIYTKRFKD